MRHRDLAEERINAKYYYIIKSALLKYNALNMDMVAEFEPANDGSEVRAEWAA